MCDKNKESISLLRQSLTADEKNEYNKRLIKTRRPTRTIKKSSSKKCRKGCCTLNVHPFKWSNKWEKDKLRTSKKAGIFIYDSTTNKVLFIQSCGWLWGPPKGGINKGESILDAAIREVKEETGLDIDAKLIEKQKPIYIKKKSYYYVLDMKECEVQVPQTDDNNDVNGITWIHIDCMDTLKIKKTGEYKITKHGKSLIENIMGKKLINTFYSCPVLTRIPKEIKNIIVEEDM